MKLSAHGFRKIVLLTLGVLIVAGISMGAVSQQFEINIYPGVSVGARIWSDRTIYNDGDAINVYFTVSQTTRWIRIWDFEATNNIFELTSSFPIPQIVVPNQTVLALSGRVRGNGSESLVLQALTTSGQIITAGCTFFVRGGGLGSAGQFQIQVQPNQPPSGGPGGVVGAVRIGFNSTWGGCDGNYRVGQVLTTYLYVGQGGTYGLYNLTRYGTLQTLIAPRYFSPGIHTFRARVTGVPGRNTAVFHGRTSAGVTLNTYCSMNVTY
jgi:hypothetical protein